MENKNVLIVDGPPSMGDVMDAIKHQLSNSTAIPHAAIISVKDFKAFTGRRLPRKFKKKYSCIFVRTNGKAYTDLYID